MRRRTLLQATMLALLPRSVRAATTLRMAIFADYNVPEVLRAFTDQTGIALELVQFESNEALLAACGRGERFDLVTVSHYMLPHLWALHLIQPLPDTVLARLQPEHWCKPFVGYGRRREVWYAVPKNFGITGFLYRRSRLPRLTGWADFFTALPQASRHASLLDDEQSLMGAALCAAGYSQNSTTPAELMKAGTLLQDNRRHVRALTMDAPSAIRAGDQLLMAFSDGGYAATEANEDVVFVHPDDGGELYCDYYAIGSQSTELPAVAALLEWLLAPSQIAREVIELGVSPVDDRVASLLSPSLQQNPIVFPPREVLQRLELTGQEALRDPLRAKLYNTFVDSF